MLRKFNKVWVKRRYLDPKTAKGDQLIEAVCQRDEKDGKVALVSMGQPPMTGVAPVTECIYDGPKATPTTPPEPTPDPPESGSGGSEAGSDPEPEPPAATRAETADEKVGVSDDVEFTRKPAPEGDEEKPEE